MSMYNVSSSWVGWKTCKTNITVLHGWIILQWGWPNGISANSVSSTCESFASLCRFGIFMSTENAPNVATDHRQSWKLFTWISIRANVHLSMWLLPCRVAHKRRLFTSLQHPAVSCVTVWSLIILDLVVLFFLTQALKGMMVDNHQVV